MSGAGNAGPPPSPPWHEQPQPSNHNTMHRAPRWGRGAGLGAWSRASWCLPSSPPWHEQPQPSNHNTLCAGLPAGGVEQGWGRGAGRAGACPHRPYGTSNHKPPTTILYAQGSAGGVEQGELVPAPIAPMARATTSLQPQYSMRRAPLGAWSRVSWCLPCRPTSRTRTSCAMARGARWVPLGCSSPLWALGMSSMSTHEGWCLPAKGPPMRAIAEPSII